MQEKKILASKLRTTSEEIAFEMGGLRESYPDMTDADWDEIIALQGKVRDVLQANLTQVLAIRNEVRSTVRRISADCAD